MSKNWVAVPLLLAGCCAVFLLQKQRAVVPITPRPLLYLLADTQREAERIPLAITRVSDAREIQVGRRIVRQSGLAAGSSGDSSAPVIVAYLNTVGLRVASRRRRKDIPYRFYLEDDPNFVNAYALPGGNVVVGRGLLMLLDTEDELAAVLGHEIAHVDGRDAIERLQYQLASQKLGLGDFYQLGAPLVQIFEAGYTKDQEFQADRTGLALAVEAGYSPAGGLTLMKRFERFESNYSEHALTPIGEFAQVPISALVEYVRSHPPASERLAALQEEIHENGWNAAQPQRALEIRDVLKAVPPRK
jgi:predicted Zn-dependent protease